jgi:hypothetical protein
VIKPSTKIDATIDAINKSIGKFGWKGGLYPEITQAIGRLTAAELSTVLEDDRTHPDFLPYLWAGHVTWAYESTWAYMVANPPKTDQEVQDYENCGGGVPDNFDPNVPLNKISLWAPQDHLTRIK